MPIKHYLILFFISLFIIPADAQVRRVSASSPGICQTNAQPPCKEVYEYDCVDIQPRFPGGNQELLKFINNTRRYPAEAYRQGVHGRVLCGFVVNEDGSISHISLVKGVEESLNNEAMRIISEMPKWESGVLDNRNVPVFCVLPIVFRL